MQDAWHLSFRKVKFFFFFLVGIQFYHLLKMKTDLHTNDIEVLINSYLKTILPSLIPQDAEYLKNF